MKEIEIAAMAVRLYAEAHPRPVQVTQAQAAEMLGVTPQTMCKMVRCGTVKLNKCGKVPISEIDRALAVDRAA